MQYSKSILLLALLFIKNSHSSVSNETSSQGTIENLTEKISKESIVPENNSKEKSEEDVVTLIKLDKSFEDNTNRTYENRSNVLKRKPENGTADEIKPVLLFPFYPFLLPEEKKDVSFPLNNDDSLKEKKEMNKEKKIGDKPFIFFDFEFNIRKIPFTDNGSKPNETALIYTENFVADKTSKGKTAAPDDWEKTKEELEKPLSLFDDFTFFPELDEEIFPKPPDLLIPDIPTHRKTVKKLRRKKREKHPELSTDLKFFVKTLFETFSKTKRDVEKTASELNLFEDKHEKKMKKSVSANVKRRSKKEFKRKNVQLLDSRPRDPFLGEDGEGSKGKIIQIRETEQKEMKISNKDKVKRFTDSTKLRRKYFAVKGDPHYPLRIKSKDRKIESFRLSGDEKTKVEPKQTKWIPNANSSAVENATNMILKDKGFFTDFIGMIDSQVRHDGSVSKKIMAEESERKKRSMTEKMERKLFYENLKKNVSDLLTRFLVIMKKLELNESQEETAAEAEDMDRVMLEATESSARMLKRPKKQIHFFKHFIDFNDADRHVVVDFNYLFLTVTLPTTFVLSILLLVCFFNLQVKGRICTSLFKRRQLLITEDDIQHESDTKLHTPVPTVTKKGNVSTGG